MKIIIPGNIAPYKCCLPSSNISLKKDLDKDIFFNWRHTFSGTLCNIHWIWTKYEQTRYIIDLWKKLCGVSVKYVATDDKGQSHEATLRQFKIFIWPLLQLAVPNYIHDFGLSRVTVEKCFSLKRVDSGPKSSTTDKESKLVMTVTQHSERKPISSSISSIFFLQEWNSNRKQ